MKKPSLLVLFLAVFMDLVGFGIVLPLLPVYSRDFGAPGALIGLIMASYSMMQFLCTPLWGRLSDRIGRRPVMLISTAGATGSYALFAFGSGMAGTVALAVLLGSRIFAGLFGASITVAQAYIADITPPAERSRRMGLIGMAFGLGFILGPAIGAFAAKKFGIRGPGFVAAALCAVNFFLACALLPESRKPGSESVPQRAHLSQWLHTLRAPRVGFMIGLFFLATFCFTCFETTLGLLVDVNFHFDANQVGYLFAFAGAIGASVQGGGIGRLVRRLGEPKLITVSLVLVAAGLAPLPFATSLPVLLVVLALLSIGSSLARPPIFGLISALTPESEQGATLGIAQSAGSLARIVGPIFAASLFDLHHSWPYLICAGIALVAAWLAWARLCRGGEGLAVGKSPDAG
ncbi:MAG: MFS transporter [Verrucomicrobia bacterium]|nr:MFS transporter [Verrucomicrobiota bacterium]